MFASTSEAPTSATCAGVSVLTVACVPTGAKRGVGRSPCGVRNVPARARPLVAEVVNSNMRLDYKRVSRTSRRQRHHGAEQLVCFAAWVHGACLRPCPSANTRGETNAITVEESYAGGVGVCLVGDGPVDGAVTLGVAVAVSVGSGVAVIVLVAVGVKVAVWLGTGVGA